MVNMFVINVQERMKRITMTKPSEESLKKARGIDINHHKDRVIVEIAEALDSAKKPLEDDLNLLHHEAIKRT